MPRSGDRGGRLEGTTRKTRYEAFRRWMRFQRQGLAEMNRVRGVGGKHRCRRLGGKILEDLNEIERFAASGWADLGKVYRYTSLEVEPSQLLRKTLL